MAEQLLAAVLDAWERSNRILVNLLRSVPEGGFAAKAMEGSPTVAQMFSHMHHERMISVFEEAPEFAGEVPKAEWADVGDRERLAEMLEESAGRVREAVKARVESGRSLDLQYDHPVLLLQLLMFHEAYHHGQIKLALKAAGQPIRDEVAGPLTWDVWRSRGVSYCREG